jgi:hypothetical protein
MEELNNKHYEKQMDDVRYILNCLKKGKYLSPAAYAPSYVALIYKLGEEGMNEYWRKAHHVKKDYNAVK